MSIVQWWSTFRLKLRGFQHDWNTREYQRWVLRCKSRRTRSLDFDNLLIAREDDLFFWIADAMLTEKAGRNPTKLSELKSGTHEGSLSLNCDTDEERNDW